MDAAGPPELLAAAGDALSRYAWDEARDLLQRALAEQETPEALELLTRACRWMHDEAGTIDAGERAFQLYRRKGDEVAAARVATWLVVDVLELGARTRWPTAGCVAPTGCPKTSRRHTSTGG